MVTSHPKFVNTVTQLEIRNARLIMLLESKVAMKQRKKEFPNTTSYHALA